MFTLEFVCYIIGFVKGGCYMVWNGNCHLIERSRLKKCIKNGNVVGFTLNNGCKTREIEINDNFI